MLVTIAPIAGLYKEVAMYTLIFMWIAVIARILYAAGYVLHSPAMRTIGAMPHSLANLAMVGCAFYVAN